MTELTSLWLPILLSAVGAFIASSIIWMVLNYHNSDWKKLPDEEGLMGAMRNAGLQPGQYMMPHCTSNKDMADPGFVDKMKAGPCGMLIIKPNGMPGMGKNLVQWFVYLIVANIFIAYLSGHALEPGADYLAVFRVTGTAAVLGYCMALLPYGIWWGRTWVSVWKDALDGVIYALIAAGVYGWLWPAAAGG